ncbi:hypothetical protein [Paraliomyxa miuraensis]|uniref:hypothetical protein n=1 Tax=Paraliomyxa miuraensis TaxID=376150 RepID=UPI002250999A|nr:hypothetical protein [Paraliomyxa miuraensis]MCX4241615.1 hypothetical protein [Paraliomyxa miuraensis]
MPVRRFTKPREDETVRRAPPQPALPPRGRHSVGVARISLRRLSVGRAPMPMEKTRCDRRREQLPLPPGFVDRRRA